MKKRSRTLVLSLTAGLGLWFGLTRLPAQQPREIKS